MVCQEILNEPKRISAELKICEEDLCFSGGWLLSFKKRNGIQHCQIFGESGLVNNEKRNQYPPKDVFNFDETESFYRMKEDSTLTTKHISRRKKNKKRLTIAREDGKNLYQW